MTISWALTSCLLIAVVLLLRFALGRNISARLRYALWLVVLVRLLIPAQLITVPAAMFPSASREEVSIAYPVSGGTPVLNFENHEVTGAGELPAASPSSNGTSGEAGSAGAFPFTAALPQILLGIWATGSCAVLLAILFSNLRFARCLRRVRRSMENAERRLPVYLADGLPSPCLFGLFRPAIYLTEDAVRDEAVLRHVLVHEETHFRHGDHIWSALRGVALALHWWNPLVWLTVVLSRQDGELACDEGALKRLEEGERTAYGETLLKLVTAKPGPRDLLRCATTMTGGRRSLRDRIARIACKRKNLVSLSVAALVLAVLCCAATFSRPVEESVGEGDGESWRTAEITVDDSGVPYRRNAGEETWTRLGGPIAPPAEWAAQDLGGRNQATALEWVSNGELHAQYVSASDAWLVVTYGRGVAAADTYVYRSEDGGVTWREMTKPPTSWHLSSVGFISPDCLIVASRLFDGAPVFITRDGGENWEEIPLPEGAYQAEEITYDGETITITVSTVSDSADLEEGWLLRSSDLGASWTTERVGGPLDVAGESYSGKEILSDHPDLNRDGKLEDLVLMATEDELSYSLWVTQGAELLWSGEAGTAHTGWGAYFLCTLDGEDYILEYAPEMWQGVCDYSYRVFSLDEDSQPVILAENAVSFDINPPQDPAQGMDLDPAAVATFLDEVNGYLSQSKPLLVTDENLLSTFDRLGRLEDDLWWLDSDLYPRDEEKSLLENLLAYRNAMLTQASVPSLSQVFSSLATENIISIEPSSDVPLEALTPALNGAAGEKTAPPEGFTVERQLTVTYYLPGNSAEQTLVLAAGEPENIVQVALSGQIITLFYSENADNEGTYLHNVPYSYTEWVSDATLYRLVCGG